VGRQAWWTDDEQHLEPGLVPRRWASR